MKRAHGMHGQCEGLTRAGMRCGNAAYTKGKCRKHAPKATHSVDGERVSISSLVKHVPKSKRAVYTAGRDRMEVEHGDTRLIVQWKYGAFEIRTVSKSLRDNLTVYPSCSNVIYIKVGEKL